jgi:hypothetical protein
MRRPLIPAAQSLTAVAVAVLFILKFDGGFDEFCFPELFSTVLDDIA